MLSFKYASSYSCILISIGLLAITCNNNNKQQKTASLFKRITSEYTGISFKNTVDENFDKNYFDNFAYVYNGGGAAIGDINNDGLPDIYFTGNEVPNKLYLNLGGMKFRDITESAGVDGGKGWDNGVTMADVNS